MKKYIEPSIMVIEFEAQDSILAISKGDRVIILNDETIDNIDD